MSVRSILGYLLFWPLRGRWRRIHIKNAAISLVIGLLVVLAYFSFRAAEKHIILRAVALVVLALAIVASIAQAIYINMRDETGPALSGRQYRTARDASVANTKDLREYAASLTRMETKK